MLSACKRALVWSVHDLRSRWRVPHSAYVMSLRAQQVAACGEEHVSGNVFITGQGWHCSCTLSAEQILLQFGTLCARAHKYTWGVYDGCSVCCS